MNRFDSITQHRKGMEAAHCGDGRDNRRNARWLGGDAENDIWPGKKVFRKAESKRGEHIGDGA